VNSIMQLFSPLSPVMHSIQGLCLLSLDKIKKIGGIVLRLQTINNPFVMQASAKTLTVSSKEW